MGQRSGHAGGTVGAADHRGHDGPVALAEYAVGDIAGERQPGHQNDHEPQLLQVEGIIRPEGPAREEGQNRQRDQGKTDHRVDIGRTQLSQHPVQFGPHRQQSGHDRRARHRQRRIAAARQQAEAERNQRDHEIGDAAPVRLVDRPAMADGQHRHHACQQDGRENQVEALRYQRDQAAHAGDQAEGADPRDPFAAMLAAHRPAALHSNQQARRQSPDKLIGPAVAISACPVRFEP